MPTPLFGPYGRAAVSHIARFAENGANALWFHGFDAPAFEACQTGMALPPASSSRRSAPTLPPVRSSCPSAPTAGPFAGAGWCRVSACRRQPSCRRPSSTCWPGCAPTGRPASGSTISPTPGGLRRPSPTCRIAASALPASPSSARRPAATPRRPSRSWAPPRQQWARHKCKRIAALGRPLCRADPGPSARVHHRRLHVSLDAGRIRRGARPHLCPGL